MTEHERGTTDDQTMTPEEAAAASFVGPATDADADKPSRRWRAVWRTHFYAGIISMPILLMLAVTGLLILYTQPISDTVDRDVRTVAVGSERVSFDDQAAAVTTRYPDESITSVVTPVDDEHATAFGLSNGQDVFVDPYSGRILGSGDPDGGIIGLANRLHGTLNNDRITIPVPTAAGVFGPDPFFADIAVGDVIVEIFACWGLILAASGVYLWWPRKRHTGKALFLPRLRKKGRARWRDLHAVPGFLLSFVLAFFVMTGLPWSGVWGSSFGFVAEKATPGTYADPPGSTVARLGDIDRFGNQINWALQDAAVPASSGPGASDQEGHEGHGGGGTSGTGSEVDGALPAALSLDGVIRAGRAEGLKPGFTLALPEDVTEDGKTLFGSYVASNPYPGRSQDARSVYFDQFTGETLGEQHIYGVGTIAKVSDYGISTHLGTQFGIINRIVMTLACLGLIWAVISGLVMYLKRRRKGTLGLPRRPRELKLANRLILISVVLAVVYPLWGASALLILSLDKVVIRRITPLRATFGQP